MKTNLKKILILALAFLLFSTSIYASEFVGKSVISLGADLNEEEKNKVLEELGNKNSYIIEVTNAEEHKYLGNFIPKEQIGNKSLSNAKITLTENGSGLNVEVSENISYITKDIYRNALLTAGIKDADVEITALSKVSGTGALTGMLKAYETITGKPMAEDIKKIANEELVLTYDLSKMSSEKEATDFMSAVKVAFSQNIPKNEDEARKVIIDVSDNYNIKLSDKQIDNLVGLFMKMKNANIDWDKLADTAIKYSKKASDYLSSEEGQSFLTSLKNFIVAFIDWIASLFKK